MRAIRADAYANTHGYSDSNAYADGNCDPNSYTDGHAEAFTDTKV